jgi:hypothetical protein
LLEFQDNTEDAITEITHISGIPAFDNEYISRRYALGTQAGALALSIQHEAMASGKADVLGQEFTEFLEERERPE